MAYYQQTYQQTIESLNSSLEKGLDLADAEKRLEQYGPNELVERGKKSPWMIFFDQFKEIMVIVLIIAALDNFHKTSNPVALFNDSLYIIADTVAFRDRISFDKMG